MEADAIPLGAPGRRCSPNPVRGVIRSPPVIPARRYSRRERSWSSASSVRWRCATTIARWRSAAPSRVRCWPCCWCTPNEVVSAERLALGAVGRGRPAGAVKTVQVHVSRLRQGARRPRGAGDHRRCGLSAAGASRASSTPTASRRWWRRAARRWPPGDAERAGDVLREALALWRGPPLADLAVGAVRAGRDRAPGGAAPRGARAADRGRPRRRAPRRAGRRARPAHARASAARAPACAADARAVPQRPPGRRARPPTGRRARCSSTSSGSSRARSSPRSQQAVLAHDPALAPRLAAARTCRLPGAAEPDRRPCAASSPTLAGRRARGAAADADRAGRGRQDAARDRGRAHESSRTSADGAWFVPLASLRRSEDVPIGDGARARRRDPRRRVRRAGAATRFLSARQLLLVVDNCEHLLGRRRVRRRRSSRPAPA